MTNRRRVGLSLLGEQLFFLLLNLQKLLRDKLCLVADVNYKGWPVMIHLPPHLHRHVFYLNAGVVGRDIASI